FDRKVWNRCSRSTLREDADLHRHPFFGTVSPDPAEIHQQIQPKNVSIESLRLRQILALDVPDDSIYFQVAPHMARNFTPSRLCNMTPNASVHGSADSGTPAAKRSSAATGVGRQISMDWPRSRLGQIRHGNEAAESGRDSIASRSLVE